MILPLKDVIAVQVSRAYRFGYSGLVIVVRGHEELFFELSSKHRRDTILAHAEKRLLATRQMLVSAALPLLSQEEAQAQALKDLQVSKESISLPTKIDVTSPVMFSSTSSTFLTFTPPKPLRGRENLTDIL